MMLFLQVRPPGRPQGPPRLQDQVALVRQAVLAGPPQGLQQGLRSDHRCDLTLMARAGSMSWSVLCGRARRGHRVPVQRRGAHVRQAVRPQDLPAHVHAPARLAPRAAPVPHPALPVALRGRRLQQPVPVRTTPSHHATRLNLCSAHLPFGRSNDHFHVNKMKAGEHCFCGNSHPCRHKCDTQVGRTLGAASCKMRSGSRVCLRVRMIWSAACCQFFCVRVACVSLCGA